MRHSFVVAADKSGSGKTTVTCGLIHVLKKRGLKVQSFKCGPDYIDPMFHREVLGVAAANLDSFFVSNEMLRMLYSERAEMADVSVTEGVMGYYDGLGGVSVEGSTWEIADIIDSPTVLVMDCKGASVSIAALIRGMLDFPGHILGRNDRDPVDRAEKKGDCLRKHDSGIRGVILNRVSPMFYERLKGVIEENCPEIRVLGFMPEMKERNIPSRHLGLIEPKDMEDFTSWIEAVSEQIEKTVDVDGILELAATPKSGNDCGCSLEDKSIAICNLKNREKLYASSDTDIEADIEAGEGIEDISEYKLKNKVRIGIAEDEAFNFYYQENRELLERMGAELVPFSPLHDEKLPGDLDGIIIGGGYPELYAEALSANASMRETLASRIKNGIPVIAECGGYMYLNNSISAESGSEKSFGMCGVFSGDACKKERLVRFGYVSAETKAPGLFGDAGTVLKGHEFHRYDCEYNGDGFRFSKPGVEKINDISKTDGNLPEKDDPDNSIVAVSEKTGLWKNKTLKRKKNGVIGNAGIYEGIYYSATMSCGWPHFYYYSNPKAIFKFMKCCERYHFERLAQKKWDGIAKPIDSLGILEKEVIKLCGIQRTLTPSIDKKALVVLCADHGCVSEGVTQTDSSVTRKVADSFVKGMTTTSIFAKGNNVDVYIVDVGMTGSRYSYRGKPYGCKAELRNDDGKTADSNLKDHPAPENSLNFQKLCQDVVNDRRLQDGSGNIAVEAAMSHEVGEKALRLGMDIVRELKESGYDIIATGEMGIGNTTPTAALLAYFMGASAEEAVGYGAGLSEEGLRRKQDVVRRALKRLKKKSGHQEGEFQAETDDFSDSASKSRDDSNRLKAESIENNKNDVSTGKVKSVSAEAAKEVLFQIGGLEIAVMAGMFLGGVRYEVPVVIDGIISTAAVLSAYIMDERVRDYALASHISKEKLARKALEKMGLRAIIDAEMSLGEGSGAVLLMPILSSAVEAFNRMGSFSDMEVEAYHRFSH